MRSSFRRFVHHSTVSLDRASNLPSLSGRMLGDFIRPSVGQRGPSKLLKYRASRGSYISAATSVSAWMHSAKNEISKILVNLHVTGVAKCNSKREDTCSLPACSRAQDLHTGQA